MQWAYVAPTHSIGTAAAPPDLWGGLAPPSAPARGTSRYQQLLGRTLDPYRVLSYRARVLPGTTRGHFPSPPSRGRGLRGWLSTTDSSAGAALRDTGGTTVPPLAAALSNLAVQRPQVWAPRSTTAAQDIRLPLSPGRHPTVQSEPGQRIRTSFQSISGVRDGQLRQVGAGAPEQLFGLVTRRLPLPPVRLAAPARG